ALRRKLGLPAGVPLVMTAGNLIESKNMGTVVRAVAHLAVEFPSLHHVIAGTGPGENALRELATGLGVADRILFVGKLGHTELCKHYQATDLYVLVSREESMGRTYFEAGACGIPVIGGRVGGVPDVIRHGANGFLVDDPEDVRETASCMEKLLCDEALRRRMGQAGLKRAPEEFSWDAVGAGFEELLICAAGGDRTSGAT
ncbi:MAG: glycosyltransferase family 4 protein, partial [Verrucomicrobia bacterium]|nr:glycosyltransferase family 4 protein [Verrucomicrobiota bacterium]